MNLPNLPLRTPREQLANEHMFIQSGLAALMGRAITWHEIKNIADTMSHVALLWKRLDEEAARDEQLECVRSKSPASAERKIGEDVV